MTIKVFLGSCELFVEKADFTDYEPKNTPHKSIEIDTLAVSICPYFSNKVWKYFQYFGTFLLRVWKYLVLPGIFCRISTLFLTLLYGENNWFF